MAKTRFIDIDLIDTNIGIARIGGNDYPVRQLSMQQYINLIAASEQTDDDAKPGEYLKQTAESLKNMIPDCPMEEFLKLTLEQMNALMAWTRELARPEDEVKNEETPQTQTPISQ